MISKKQPGSKTLPSKQLLDILCGERDKSIHVIENIIQRDFVWTFACMETLWNDVNECIRINISEGKNGLFSSKVFNSANMVAGNIEYSTIDKCNQNSLKELSGGIYKSIVDGSQRNRITMFMAFAFMYEIAKVNQIDYMDLSSFKSSNGEFKLIEIGSNLLSDFYNKIETTKVSEIAKDVKKTGPIETFSKNFEKDDEKRDYYDVFLLFIKFIERDIIGYYDLMDSFNIVMHNVWFYEEFIDEDSKFERFVDRNKKGTPMSDVCMYPKYIINQFNDENEKQKVFDAYLRYEEKAEEAQIRGSKKTSGFFRTTKNGVDSILYIMIEVLKIKLAQESLTNNAIDLKPIFSSTFNLGNIDYGVEKCFRKKLVFKTANDAVSYFNDCYNMADFLIKDSFSRHDSLYDDCYYLRDFSKQDVLWWYFIKPCFIAQTLLKEKMPSRFIFIKKMLYRIYVFYVVYRSSCTNSQSLINLLERISAYMITNYNSSEEEFEKLIRGEVSTYIENAGGYEVLYDLIHSLSYNIKAHKNAIAAILISMEYDLCEKFELGTDVFYSLWKKKKFQNYHLDHWFPENLFKNLANASEFHRIGNMVLLETSLNSSKQDNTDVNSKYYTQSKFTQTLLMNEENRGTFNNKILNDINNYPYFERFSEDEINNPNSEMILKRTNKYATFFVDFVKDFVENKTDKK